MAVWPFQFILGLLVPFLAHIALAGEEVGRYRGKVLGVTSGDTMVVMNEDQAEKIRVAGVVAPHYEQDAGKEAKVFLTDLVRLKNVTVVHSGTVTEGIPRAKVDLDDGRKVAEELLKNGWAWWDREDVKEDKSLEDLESVARKEKRGIWIEENPIPPWEFRKGARKDPSAGLVPEVLGRIPSSASIEIPAAAGAIGSTGMRRMPVDTNYSVPRTSTQNLSRQTEYWNIDNRRRDNYQRGVQRHTTEHLYYNQRRR